MKRQWHPPFYELMRLLLSDWYNVRTEVPVSELPRAGDLLVVRRDKADPPFRGIWSHLREYHVIEFKGPTDEAEEDDLELLMAVGCGLTIKVNEERREAKLKTVEPNQVALWLAAPQPTDGYIGRARLREAFDYHLGGFWTATAWRHPVRLLSYRAAAVEEDPLPFFLVDGERAPPAGVAPLLAGKQELIQKSRESWNCFSPSFSRRSRTWPGNPVRSSIGRKSASIPMSEARPR
ncbi:MAG: hypothetical protein K2W96_19290 [Gemmataceae bacterium]|nr:hypothetical protein [Gemmataceae bacterium]